MTAMAHPAPLADGDALEVLDDAIVALAARRGVSLITDTPVLHLLASLILQAGYQLPLAVCSARAERCSWHDIAQLLGTTAAEARERFEGTPVLGGRWSATP